MIKIVVDISGMIIRPAISDDAEQIALVHVLSWQAIYKDHMPKSVLENLSHEKRSTQWRERIAQGVKAWIIEKDKNIVGFVSICPARDADIDPNKVIEISAIYLLPEFWGKGFGKKLCKVVFDYAIQNEFKEIILWVLEGNTSAHRFYESLGFNLTDDTKTEHIGSSELSVIKYKKVC